MMKYFIAIIMTCLLFTACATTRSTSSSDARIVERSKEVVMYSTSWCIWCKSAKAFMKEEGISYVEKNLNNPEDYKELVATAKRINYEGPLNAVPLFIIHENIIVGFNPDEILCLLKKQKCSSVLYERVKTSLK